MTKRSGTEQRRWGSRSLAAVAALLLAVGFAPALLDATPAQAAASQGFHLNASDLRFILRQIKIAEQHARTATRDNPCGTLLGSGPDQIPNANGQGVFLPWGLRTVDGSCNNLQQGKARTGASDNVFPRRTPRSYRGSEAAPPMFPPAAAGGYNSTSGYVYDSQPRVASNLIVDQTTDNPAAVAAAGPGAVADSSRTLPIPNVAPDAGLSAPFNSLFTLFGQFFDHGLDLVPKSGGTVFIPLRPGDPLYKAGSPTNFMVLTRAANQPGPDGKLGTADDVRDSINQTTPWVDQSQTYTSHPSQQVFMREYALDSAGAPVSTGRLLTGPGDGPATWGAVKEQARTLLGIALSDQDVSNVPLLATDPYGRFLPGAGGRPQIVTPGGLVEGDPAANGGAGVAVPADASRTGHAFLDDIAHHAVPFGDNDGNPATPPGPLTPDADPGTGDDGVASTYDDEMLAAHYVAGDGRINENIGLTAVHQVFHAEHNRLVGDIKDVLTTKDPTQVPEWQLAGGAWNGERLFQAARFVTEMEYQHLAFEEFARRVQPAINEFGGYDPSIDPAITAEFAHAVYRFGHSMLTETISRRSPGGGNRDIKLFDAFLNPPSFTAGGRTPEQASGDIMRGMSDQVGAEIDEFVTDALRNQLVGLPLDLATLNIVRARETGVPPLNAARRQFSAQTNGNAALAPYANWIDFGLALRHPESLINFVAAYGTHPTVTHASTLADKRAAAALLVAADAANPATPGDAVDYMNGTGTWADAGGRTTTGLDDVDLWVGGLAERPAPFGGLLGSTFNVVFEAQMEALQDGDRFYYLSRTGGLNLGLQLENNSFAELVARNTDAPNLPADAFSRLDLTFDLNAQPATGAIVDDPATSYDERSLLSRATDGTIRYTGGLHVLFTGTAGGDRVRAGSGNDTVRGHDGDDRLDGGEDADQVIGGAGDDILTDVFGDDVLMGSDGDDALSSGPGLDVDLGGLGDDFIVPGPDATEVFGGPGNDVVLGGDGEEVADGDDGDDWLEGGAKSDRLAGDNGAPFADDPNAPGDDVLDGGSGDDRYDAEGGTDVLISGPGLDRYQGMLGFDWVTHRNDPVPADDDLTITALTPPAVGGLRDRFDTVEGLSGGSQDDSLRGDSRTAATMTGHELDATGIARYTGLAGVLPAGTASFTGGNILLGGEGSDLIEGRGGDDVIDGDAWLDVQLQAPDPVNPGVLRSVASASALQADVFAGRLDPGDIDIVRTVVASAPGDFVDTAVFTGPSSDYEITATGGVVIVSHLGGTGADGTDTLRNVERLQFADQTLPAPGTATGTPPGPPVITFADPLDGQVLLGFEPPVDEGDSRLSGYQVQVFTGTTLVTTVSGIGPAESTALIDGLTNGTAYTFRVLAVNESGPGEPSAPSVEVTPVGSAPVATAPDAPLIGTATRGDASATVAWTAPADGGAPITSYRVQVRTGTTLVRTVMNVPATATSTVVTGLSNGTAYNFRVRAVNAVGTGPLSASSNAVTPAAAVATAPGAPVIGAATAGSASATVTWTTGAAGSSPTLRYEVQARTGTTVRRTVTVNSATATSTVVTGLTNGTAYNFRVRAVNAVGAGAWSGQSNVVTPRAAATAPGAPVIGTAAAGTAGGAVTATARWTPPASTGGSAITGYVVRALRMSSTGTVLATTTSTVQPASARSLSMVLPVAGNYRFTVQARNAVGSGVESARSNQVAGR